MSIPSNLKEKLRGIARNARRIIKVLKTSGNDDLKGHPPKSLPKKRKRGGAARFAYYEESLFGAFGGPIIRELEEICASHETAKDVKAYAYWARGRYHLANGAAAEAVSCLKSALSIAPEMKSKARHHILLVEALRLDGRTEEALEVSRAAAASFRKIASVMLTTPVADDDERLSHINHALLSSGLSPLRLRDPSKPLSIENVAGVVDPPDTRSKEAKVSIIVPAFNAEGHLEYCLASLTAQTWSNIEILVVDDCSSDRTFEIAKQMAALDTRIRVIRNETNRGAYASRNAGLRAASGDYVTVNDADDWAHPRKIAIQVKSAIDGREPFNCSSGCRVLPDMTPVVSPKDGSVMVMNVSSTLYKRADLIRLGGWDEVRFAADAEMYERVEASTGQKLTRFYRETPMTFILSRADSLTKAGATAKASMHYGARREYQESYKEWHRITTDLRIDAANRPFPVPSILLTPNPPTREVDLLFVSDYALRGGTISSTMAMFDAATAGDRSFALLHWPRLDSARRPINDRVRQSIHSDKLSVVVPGEKVRAKLVIVNHPNLLMNRPSSLPEVETDRCIVLFNQSPFTRAGSTGTKVYDPLTVMKMAETAFGCRPVAAPISGIIRQILQEYELPYEFTDDDWLPLVGGLSDSTPHRTADMTRAPVVGRHSRDDEDKWLFTKASMEGAYFANSKSIKVRVMGGADHAVKVLGYVPSNWQVLPFGADVGAFLDSIDFHVYFPREDMIEAFGRSPMEAMANGIPTILPFNMEPTFGAAATYARPEDVAKVVTDIWNDPARYAERSQSGIRFVREHCHPSLFSKRVQRAVG
jgi:tetratricopeptide (TPR) repeat protein